MRDPSRARTVRPQVVSPRVRAFLYTWAHRTTAEGEAIPFRCDPIHLAPSDHLSLVLPLTLEHDIDERSPLYGHTYDSLTVRAPCLGRDILHVTIVCQALEQPPR